MRPAGEVRQALLRHAGQLAVLDAGSGQVVAGPSLQELAAAAGVGYDAALATVKNMVRAQVLRIVRKRPVDYRNKPVAEYAPALAAA